MLLDREQIFRSITCIVLVMLAGLIFGVFLPQSPNDAARWDTIWSLTEFGTYQIFDTKKEAEKWDKPEQYETIDKVARKFEEDGKTVEKMYSSKPPLLPTVAAGIVRVMRQFGPPITKDIRGKPTQGTSHRYFKPTLMILNLLPFLWFLVLYRGYLNEWAATDYSFVVCLTVAALGSLATGYLTTLNNHTMAAHFAGITLLLLWPIWHRGSREGWRLALAGLCAGWTAANELPAAAFAIAVFLFTLRRAFLSTIVFFLPPLVLVVWAFFCTNHQSFGSYIPAYLQPEMYDYEGSYWRSADKSAIDALSTPREDGTFVEGPRVAGEFTRKIKETVKPTPGGEGAVQKPTGLFVSPAYLLHMTFGHHGVFSMTPIWLFAFIGLLAALGAENGWRKLSAWMLLLIVLITFAFYWMVNTERNYGGFCHGMRWLLWLSAIWLMYLPPVLDRIAHIPFWRWIVGLALGVSIFSVADTWANPWTYSWIHRILIWCGLVGY
jgi:hypothetical protein